MAARNMEPLNITNFSTSTLEMVFQTFTAASVAACLLVSLSPVLSPVTEKPDPLDWEEVTDLVIEEYFIFVY